MKFFTKKSIAMVVAILTLFSIMNMSAMAAENSVLESQDVKARLSDLPSGYTNCVAGNVQQFSGSTATVTVTLPSSYTGVYMEFGMSDPGNLDSQWVFDLISSPNGTVISEISWVSGDASYDYEYLANAPAGTYKFSVRNSDGLASSNTFKNASVLFWSK